MKDYYKMVFAELIDMMESSRDACIQNTENYGDAKGAVLSLGDARFASYASMVGTNELRAAKAIERLAVLLFEASKDKTFSLYPIDHSYRFMETSEQAKTRPFQIILKENGKNIGVVFCLDQDAGNYYKHLNDGDYAVDSLRLVLLQDPDKFTYEVYVSSINDFNKKCNIPIERWTIREFWERYFGGVEFDTLIAHLNCFNERAKKIIGFSTIVTPTAQALQKFRDKTGKMICDFPYQKAIPDSVFPKQVEIFYKNYIDRGLWRAMVGKANFAISFITSEWNYQMYQMTENLDLTSVVTGYLKSIEQLLWTIIELQDKKQFRIKSTKGRLVEFSIENESVIDSTLCSLENVIKHNSWMLDVNYHARVHLVDAIGNWRSKYRNGYFHKHNLQSIDKAWEIREQTLQLYFLILGGCTIKDSDFIKLGID